MLLELSTNNSQNNMITHWLQIMQELLLINQIKKHIQKCNSANYFLTNCILVCIMFNWKKKSIFHFYLKLKIKLWNKDILSSLTEPIHKIHAILWEPELLCDGQCHMQWSWELPLKLLFFFRGKICFNEANPSDLCCYYSSYLGVYTMVFKRIIQALKRGLV